MTDVDEAGIPTIAPRALTIHAVEPVGVAWSRDGKSLLFTMGAPGPLRLWRLRVDPLRAAERIEIAGDWVRHPATAATRDRLAFSQVTWDSHLYRFDAGHSVEEVAPSSSFESDPHFSPDGRRLAFLRALGPRPDLGRSGGWVEPAPAHAQRAPVVRLTVVVAGWTLDRVRQWRYRRAGSHLDRRRGRRHASSERTGPETSRYGPATGNGSTSPTIEERREISGACPRREGSPTRCRGLAAASWDMSSATVPGLCISRFRETRRCCYSRSQGAPDRGGSSTASDRRHSLRPATQWSTGPAIRARGRRFVPSIRSAERIASWDDSRIFLRERCM